MPPRPGAGRRQRRPVRRAAAAAGAGRLGRAGGHVRHRARRLCRPPEGATIYGLFSAMLAFVPAGRCSARPSRRASAGGRSSSRWARRACWRGCAPCRAGANPSIRAGRGGRAHAGQPAVLDLRWDSARRWAPSSCSSRPRRAAQARPATPHGLQRGLLDGRAGLSRPRGRAARWGIAGSFARGAATMLAGGAPGRLPPTASFATFVMPMAGGGGMVLVVSVKGSATRAGRGGATLTDAGRRQRLAAGRLLRRHAHGLPAGTGPAATQEAARRED